MDDFRSKTAATLGSILFFATFFPYYYVGGDAQSSVGVKTWASLLAPTCLALGSDTFAAYEGGKPVVYRSNVPFSNVPFLGVFLQRTLLGDFLQRTFFGRFDLTYLKKLVEFNGGGFSCVLSLYGDRFDYCMVFSM